MLIAASNSKKVHFIDWELQVDLKGNFCNSFYVLLGIENYKQKKIPIFVILFSLIQCQSITNK